MFQACVPLTLKLVNMPTSRFCLLYRVGVNIRQCYSTGPPPYKIVAASASRCSVAKTKPKRITEVLDEEAASTATEKVSAAKLVKLSHTEMVNNSRKVVENKEILNESIKKPVPLHDALDPRELEWKEFGAASLSSLPGHYLMLAKFRLTSLVVLTSMGGYIMAPYPLEFGTFLALALGTGLVSSAANAMNQFLESPFDAQMPRTRNRALVRGLLTPAHAVGFALGSAISGTCILWTFTNPSTVVLGMLNLLLYTSVYTPLKRVTIANTWVGSIVGSIPPLMGWSACSGGSLEVGAWLMAGLLFAWQFPHFNALSWNLRQEYSRAGYRMMAVTNPDLCKITALRYSVGMLGLCVAAPMLDITTWTFAFDSLPLNMYLTYLAWKFYKESDSKSSRNLFRFTLIHLPLLMILMLISKKHYSAGNQTLEVNQLGSVSVGAENEGAPGVISVMPVTGNAVS